MSNYFLLKPIAFIEKLIEKGLSKKLDCINNNEFCKHYNDYECKETCKFARDTYNEVMIKGVGSKL